MSTGTLRCFAGWRQITDARAKALSDPDARQRMNENEYKSACSACKRGDCLLCDGGNCRCVCAIELDQKVPRRRIA